jgi:hypothetical protein
VIDPRSRQRLQIVPVEVTETPTRTNAEFVRAWARASEGKIAAKTVQQYHGVIRDLVAYMVDDAGREIPVARWTKPQMWGYLHFVEANYCARFKGIIFDYEGARCLSNVWTGRLPHAEAAQKHCTGCQLFKRQPLTARLNAICKFFRFLARIGAVPVNFLPDIRAEVAEDKDVRETGEKRRNPSLEEVRLLVNGTVHIRDRALYAAGAKWWGRINEILRLDRYASFGLPTPKGLPVAPGFARGFAKHPEVKNFEEGGDLVYLPERITPEGRRLPDKRRGNRWFVIDAELRPILEQYIAWWELHVERDANGTPTHSSLWIGERGRPLQQKDVADRHLFPDAERLGLMVPGDRQDPLRRWTYHCFRHFGQRLNQNHKVPDLWNHHFRGDVLGDARDNYNEPEPLEVREAYLSMIPPLGFSPLPDAARLETHTQDPHRALVLVLRQAVDKGPSEWSRVVRVLAAGEETVFVPKFYGPSVLQLLRQREPTKGWRAIGNRQNKSLARSYLLGIIDRALGATSA